MGGGRRLLRQCRFCAALLILAIVFSIPFGGAAVSSSSYSAGQSNGLCISQGGRFPTFLTEGKKPARAAKGPRDLTLCRVFRGSTCCDVSQTYPASLLVRRLASTGEGSQECLHLWELLECSICDPRVGVRPGPPLICGSFCKMVFDACMDAYFSVDLKAQVLLPCGLGDIVCGRAREWASNGTELCRLAGFYVQESDVSSDEVSELFCYGGKTSLDYIANSWKDSKDGSAIQSPISWVIDAQQYVRDMTIAKKLSWAIGGAVLCGCLVFMRKSKRQNVRQKQAEVIYRAATRRLEANSDAGRTRTSG